jgi:hypothetical protein
MDTVLPGADDGAQRDRAEEGVDVLWPLMPTLWNVALQHAWAPTTRSGQPSALFTRVNVSKAGAHRSRNQGWQHGHAVQARLGQQVAASRDLHADHRAAEPSTAALSRH